MDANTNELLADILKPYGICVMNCSGDFVGYAKLKGIIKETLKRCPPLSKQRLVLAHILGAIEEAVIDE